MAERMENSGGSISGILDRIPDGVLIVDEEGTIMAANAQIEALLGHPPESLLGQRVESLVPVALRERHVGLRRGYTRDPSPRAMHSRGPAPLRIEGLHREGHAVPLDIMLGPVEGSTQLIMAVLRDVSHLREVENRLAEANAALEVQNEELRELSEKKNRFLGIAAHDLRNPLAAIRGYARLMKEGAVGSVDERQRTLLQRIDQNVDYMLGMIEELLDITAIESGELSLRLRRVDPERLIQETLGVQRMVADHKNMTIKLHSPGDIPFVRMDPGKFEQVVHNLVSNAIKYSDPGSLIDVYIEHGGEFMKLAVEDRGQGIPADDLPHVFDPFRRSTAAPTGGESSTGLGLAIARRIVEAHRGEIRVSSTLGVGSTFTVLLPFGRPSDPASSPDPPSGL